MLFFAKRNTKEVGNDTPVLVARADGAGYFFGDAPNEQYESAAALVAGVADEIPVRLDEGVIPARVILAVELPGPNDARSTKGDCECEGSTTPRSPQHSDIENAPETYSTDLGTGRCVQFWRHPVGRRAS